MPNGYIKSKNGTPIELVDAYAREQLDLKVDIIQDVSDKGKVFAVGETGNVELVDININNGNGNADWNAKESEVGYILNRPFYDEREIFFDSSNGLDIENSDCITNNDGNVLAVKISEYVPLEELKSLIIELTDTTDSDNRMSLDIITDSGNGFYFLSDMLILADNSCETVYDYNVPISGIYIIKEVYDLLLYDAGNFIIGKDVDKLKKIDKKFIPVNDLEFKLPSLVKDRYYYSDFNTGIYLAKTNCRIYLDDESNYIYLSKGSIVNIFYRKDNEISGMILSTSEDFVDGAFMFSLSNNSNKISYGYFVTGDKLSYLDELIKPSDEAEDWEWDRYHKLRDSIPTSGAVKDYVDNLNEPFIITITKHYDSETGEYIIDSMDKTYNELISALDGGNVAYLKDGEKIHSFVLRTNSFVEFGGVEQASKLDSNRISMYIMNFRISNNNTCSIKCSLGGIFLTSSAVLSKSNTLEYTPTSDYHPATKKYVDDSVYDDTDVKSRLETLEGKTIPTVTNDFTDTYKNRLDVLTDEYILSLLPKYDGGVE